MKGKIMVKKDIALWEKLKKFCLLLFLPRVILDTELFLLGGQIIMKKKLTIVKNIKKLPPGKTNWHRIKTMSETALTAAAESDPDARLSSAKELLGFKRVKPLKQIDVKKVRKLLRLSQEKFAAVFGISKRTLQEWEQHRSEPSIAARNFLRVIEKEPEAVQRALG
jgi:putative transcriptional regulator